MPLAPEFSDYVFGCITHSRKDGCSHFLQLFRCLCRCEAASYDEFRGVYILPNPKVGRYSPQFSSARKSSSFNPRPTRRSGATRSRRSRCRPTVGAFQSSPNPKVGRYDVGQPAEIEVDGGVSILAQPEGRALLPDLCRRLREPRACFNPRPTRRSGATVLLVRPRSQRLGFNPRPTRRSGATVPPQAVDLLGVFSPFPRSSPWQTEILTIRNPG